MDSHDDPRKLVDEELMQVSGGEGEPQAPDTAVPPCPKCGTDAYEVLRSSWYSEDHKHLYMDLFCRKCNSEHTVRYY